LAITNEKYAILSVFELCSTVASGQNGLHQIQVHFVGKIHSIGDGVQFNEEGGRLLILDQFGHFFPGIDHKWLFELVDLLWIILNILEWE
jgi:hypothetical protein